MEGGHRTGESAKCEEEHPTKAEEPWKKVPQELAEDTDGSRELKAVEATVPETLPLGKQWLYAVGQLGWSMLAGLVGLQLVYFYIPPEEDGEPVFRIYVTQSKVLVIFNIIMILATAGRLWDAVTDPLIADFSDRLRHPWGRRMPCMAAGGLPAAVTCALLFVPVVGEESGWNVAWLATMQTLFYLFITLYCTPYFSLVAELGRSEKDRLNLSTWISVTYALGTLVAASAPTMGRAITGGASPTASLQAGVVVVCVLSAICMYVPVFTIDENRYSTSVPSTVGVVAAVRHCLANPYFRPYVAADFSYWFASAIMTTGMPYFLSVLVQVEDSLQLAVFGVIMGVSFCFYFPTNLIAQRHGKKKPVMLALIILNVVFALIFFLGRFPAPGIVQIFALGLVVAFPLAVLGVLPNAILADIAVHDAVTTGANHEGMYFAARALLSKLGQSCGIMIFASLTNFGKDVGDDLGIRLSGPAGMVFGLGAIWLFSYYKEEELISCRQGSCPAVADAASKDPAAHGAVHDLEAVKVPAKLAEYLPYKSSIEAPAGRHDVHAGLPVLEEKESPFDSVIGGVGGQKLSPQKAAAGAEAQPRTPSSGSGGGTPRPAPGQQGGLPSVDGGEGGGEGGGGGRPSGGDKHGDKDGQREASVINSPAAETCTAAGCGGGGLSGRFPEGMLQEAGCGDDSKVFEPMGGGNQRRRSQSNNYDEDLASEAGHNRCNSYGCHNAMICSLIGFPASCQRGSPGSTKRVAPISD